MSKLFLAEDDLNLSSVICDHLRKQKHAVESVADGLDAQNLLHASKFDLLILDWSLPNLSGIELCRNYRSRGGASPVLMLTGKSSIAEKETGLDSGADDYLTKPFDLRELSARVRALLRRPDRVVDNILKYGKFTLDPATCRVTKDGEPLELFPKEFAILEFLMRHPDQIFSAEALQERIWTSDSESSPDAIRVHIARLRSKLQSSDSKPIIRTAYRAGYMFDTAAVE